MRKVTFLFLSMIVMAAICSAQISGNASNPNGHLSAPRPIYPIDPDPARHVSVVSELQIPLAHDAEVEEIIAKLDPAKLGPVRSESWEGTVLAAAKKSVREILQIHLEDPNGPMLFTLPEKDGDVLVARWNIADSARLERTIWLWDTPFKTVFLAEVPQTVLRPEELTRYCEGLFFWYNGSLTLKTLKLSYLEIAAGKEEVAGIGEYMVGHIFVTGLAGHGRAYIKVSLHKPAVAFAYPDEAYQVRERFPPLRTRLGGLSRQALIEEQGKGYVNGQTLTYPYNRDVIVLRELLSRGPVSPRETRRIVVGNFSKGDAHSANIVGLRMDALLSAIHDREQLAACAPTLAAILLDTPILKNMEDVAIGRLFFMMAKYQIDFSTAAWDFLEQGRYVTNSLLYLQESVATDETLRKLEGISLSSRLDEERRNSAIATIRKRLGGANRSTQ